jgi:hypothetical protein
LQTLLFAFDSHHFVSQSQCMKTLLRVSGGLSFLFFVVAGLCLLSTTLSSPASDAFALTAVGFFFVGTAFLVGPILLVATAKLRRNAGSK